MATKTYSVGTSTLTVIPDFTGAQTKAKAFTDQLARNMREAIRGGIENGLNPAPLLPGAARTGNAVGGTLADTIRGRLQAALRNLPEAKIGAATTEAEAKIRELREQIAAVSGRIGVDLNSEQAVAEIATIEAQLKALSENTTDLDVRADTDKAARALALIRAEVDRINGTEATVAIEANVGNFAAQVRRALERAQAALPPLDIDANTSPAQRELQLLRTRIETLSGRTIGVDIDAADALADLAALEAQLTELSANTTEVDVDVNAAAAAAALATVRAEIERLRAERVVVPVEANAGRFLTSIRAAIDAAQASIRDIEVGLDTAPATAELAGLRADLATLSAQRIGVDIDAATALAELARIRTELDRLAASDADIDVRTDAAAASAELARVEAQVNRLDGRTARVDVDSTSLNTFTGRIVLIGSAIAALAPAALPALGATVLGIGAIGAAAGAVLPAIGALVLGLSGVGGALSAMAKADEDAAKTAATAAAARTAAAAQVVSAQRSLEGAEASLANARASAASAATRAAQTVAAASAAVIKAEDDAARAVTEATQRQVDAKAALELAVSEAAYDAEQSARRVADAEKALAQATTAATIAVANAEQRLADARQATTDIAQRANDRMLSALAAREAAERTLAEVNARSLDLEQALTDARTGAAQSLEDQSLRLAGNALRAQQQTLDLADAQRALAKVRADPTASADDIARAELAVRSQQQSIDELAVSNARLQAQYAAASAAGVEGSDRVRSAQQAIADQTQRIADAETALAAKRAAEDDARAQAIKDVATARQAEADAQSAVVAARLDGTTRIADAEQNLADVRVGADRAAQASARSLESARRAVVDAEQAVTDAGVNGAASVLAAQQRVADAQVAQAEQQRTALASIDGAVRGLEGSQASLAAAYTAAGTAGVAAVDEVQQAMDKLGPAGQTFATFLYSLRPQVEALQNAGAAGLLPGLQTALEKLLPLMPTFEGLLNTFGTAIGDLAIKAADALNGDLFAGFFDFLQKNGPAIVDTAGKIVGNLLSIFPALAEAFGPIGQQVGDVLVDLTGDFVEFLRGLAGSDAFENFIAYVKENAPLFGEFLGKLADAFVKLIEEAAPFGPIILGIIGKLLDFIVALPPGVISAIVLGILGLVGVFNLLGPVIAFVSGIIAAVSAGVPILGAVIAALGGPVTLIIAAIVLLVAAFVAAYQHSETFRDIVNGAFDAVKRFVVDVIWEQGIKPAFEALATFFTKTIPDAANFLWRNAIQPAFEGIRSAVETAIGVVRTILDALVYVWQNIIKPAALFLWHNVFEPVFNGIRFAVEVAWNILKLIFDLLVFYFQNVIRPAAEFLWHNVFEPAFAGISAAVRYAWESIIKPAFDALVAFWKNTLQPAAFFLRDNVFKPVFSALGDAVKFVWENVIRPALQALSDFFSNTLQPAVETGVKNFKNAFALMREAASVPINFVIREVYTGGIKKLFDGVAVAIGSDARLPELKEITVPKAALASGGRVPGSSPTRTADNIPIMATANEYMQPVAAHQYYGTAVMDAIRRRAIPREAFQRLAGGGTVEGLVALGRKLQGIGIRVSENKFFGGVDPNAHSAGGWHYKLNNSGAIDLNLGVGNPKGEKEALDRAVSIAQADGFRTIWQASGHYDHAHADLGAGQSIGSGGGFLGSVVDGVKGLGSSASELLGDLWKGAKDMLSPFTDAIARIGAGVGQSPFGQLTGSAATKVFGFLTDWVRGKANDAFGGSGDSADSPVSDAQVGGGVEKWRSTALKALSITGQPASWIGSLLRRMMQESSGDPNAVNGWDSNAAKGLDYRSKGLMQVIGPTFRANSLTGYDSNIFDPLSNIIAAIRYTVQRYGTGPKGWDRAGGYAAGGPITDLLGDAPGQVGRPLLFDEGGRLPVGLSVVANRTGAPEAVFNARDELALRKGVSSMRSEELLAALVDLAGTGNDLAQDGFEAMVGALDEQPRRAQQLARQGVRS